MNKIYRDCQEGKITIEDANAYFEKHGYGCHIDKLAVNRTVTEENGKTITYKDDVITTKDKYGNVRTYNRKTKKSYYKFGGKATGLTKAQTEAVNGWQNYADKGEITQAEADKHIREIYDKAGATWCGSKNK